MKWQTTCVVARMSLPRPLSQGGPDLSDLWPSAPWLLSSN